MNIKKIKLASLTFYSCAVGVTIYVFFCTPSPGESDRINNTSLIWQEYQSQGEEGLLYMISDTTSENKFYLSLEKEVSKDDFSDNQFLFTLVDKKEAWNPRVCAKMPSVIDSDGNIFMLDYTYKDGVFIKHLIKFSYETKKTTYTDVTELNIVGKIYLSNNKIFFFSVENEALVRNTLAENDETLERTNVPFSGKVGQLKFNFYDETSTLHLQVIENDLTTEEYVYDFTSNTLTKTELDQSRSGTNLLKRKKLHNGVVMYWDLSNPFNIGFVTHDTYVPIFKQNLNVYTYIIGGY